MRLELQCQNRFGITHEILDLLVKQEIELRGVEIDPAFEKIYIAIPNVGFDVLQELMAKLRLIPGVIDVKTTAFMPKERLDNELQALFKTLPDGVISVDSRGRILVANDSALQLLDRDSEIIGENIHQFVKGINLPRQQEEENSTEQTVKVQLRNDDYLADVLPIEVSHDEGQTVCAGAVIILKSRSNMGKQMIAFNKNLPSSFNTVHAQSPSMKRVLVDTSKVCQLDAPLLISGATGTGKFMVSRASHDASSRQNGPFIPVTCSTLTDADAENILFGHSNNGGGGLFGQAHEGTLLFKEVGDLSPHAQALLLRFLAEDVAEGEVRHPDVRVICTTRHDLQRRAQEGTFREDLYYRINVLHVELPTLAERRADIQPIVNYFLQKYASLAGKRVPHISDRGMTMLEQYEWPGNVRQIENLLYRAVSVCERDTLDVCDMQLPVLQKSGAEEINSDQPIDGSLGEMMSRYEAQLLRRLYPSHPSSRQLAKRLGLSHTAIANKLREYGINRKSSKS